MPEPTATVETKVEPAKVEDIVSRVAKFKEPENSKPSQTQDSLNSDKFDVRDIEKIADPIAKEYALKAYKSFEKDYRHKTSEIGEMRRTYEQKMLENSRWTPERVKSLLNDQEFVKSAETVAGLNQQIESGQHPQIPEAEKQKIKELDEQMKAILNQNAQLVRQQQHEQFKARYADYDPQAVDQLANDLLQGKVTATPEHLYKVLNFEKAIERAYKLGLEDRKVNTQEKVSSSSADGLNVATSKEAPKKNEGEHPQDFFKRILANNFAKSKTAGG